jgi:hypothetical protein
MATASSPRAPWHLWAAGLVGLAWNSFGAFDYSMTQLRGDAHLRDFGMTDAQIAHMAAMPGWMTAAWATGVWGAVAGSLMLLFRRRLAVPLFAVSLVAFVASLVYSYGLSNGFAVMGGTQTLVMNLVILSMCIVFLLYARAMARAGVLR